jgi:2-polyprenyl-6-methoxyphenol hydroxylase-like FAD-dependent oxidoreductase
MNEGCPVLVVGAGPTGLTAALELARLNVPVRLVDKYATPPTTSRALAVQSRTMELLQQRGIAGEMLELGNRGWSAALYDGARPLGTVDFDGIDSRFNFILLLAQSETERILREKLLAAGIEVERETEMIAFAQAEGASCGVRVTLRKANGDVEEIDAAYLIDAEGAHSSARHSLDLAFAGNSLPNTYAIADLYLDGAVPDDALSIFIPEAGLVAAFPMGQRRFRVLATEKHGVAHDAPAPGIEAMQAAWARSVPIPVAMRDLQWSSRFRINSRALTRLRHGAIFFAGDAAHIHSPAGGQGMNTGMQDVINLAWKMALVYRGIAIDALLDSYDEERLPIIDQLVSTTERATDLFNSESHFVHTLLRHLLPQALRIDAVRRKGAGIVSELNVQYRKSPINGNSEGHGAAHPGDRLPDVPLDDTGAERVLDLLDPSRFTVLTLGTSSFQPDGALYTVRHVPFPSAPLLAALGDATVAVVRPDGYLLCAGSPAFVQEQMADWSRRWLAVSSNGAIPTAESRRSGVAAPGN